VPRFLIAIAAVVLAVVLLLERSHARDSAKAEPVAMQPVGSAAAPTTAPAGQIKKITPDERRELEHRIDAARAARGHAATSAGERPHLPPAKGGLENLPPGALALLNQALPYLGACYGNGPRITGPHNAIVLVSLHGDPDVGTLIDAGEMHDDKGAAIDPDVASCLTTTLQSLQLPPMATGDTVDVQFSFRY
jgi:hypothetical protein